MTVKSFVSHLETIIEILSGYLDKHQYRRFAKTFPYIIRGMLNSRSWDFSPGENTISSHCTTNERAASDNHLKSYFDAHTEGRGIWKWTHYFDIYDRHFHKFVGREVNILEIGIYSGGSLEMWKEYFGPKCHVYGVDIEQDCKGYENEFTKIAVGDQEDRAFWTRVKEDFPCIDILIDDGGHRCEQQIATIEEMLPHLRPGGVYLCEDVQGEYNEFASYIYGLASNLNASQRTASPTMECDPTPFQTAIGSIHLYPFVTVIEKVDQPVVKFSAPKHGTEWQPWTPSAKSEAIGRIE